MTPEIFRFDLWIYALYKPTEVDVTILAYGKLPDRQPIRFHRGKS